MPVLFLRFDAPMQSWGTQSRFARRDTGTEPTKSGVVGLLASALGIARDDDQSVAQLARLRMGVRVDREGTVEEDFHTVQDVPNTIGENHRGVISRRYYLADALFLVALEAPDEDTLRRLHHALQHPKWPLYLGRKAFVPARPIVASTNTEPAAINNQSMEEALATHPWLETQPGVLRQARNAAQTDSTMWLRTVTDADPTDFDIELRHDHPLSFQQQDRRYTPRAVRVELMRLTPGMITESLEPLAPAAEPRSPT